MFLGAQGGSTKKVPRGIHAKGSDVDHVCEREKDREAHGRCLVQENHVITCALFLFHFVLAFVGPFLLFSPSYPPLGWMDLSAGDPHTIRFPSFTSFPQNCVWGFTSTRLDSFPTSLPCIACARLYILPARCSSPTYAFRPFPTCNHYPTTSLTRSFPAFPPPPPCSLPKTHCICLGTQNLVVGLCFVGFHISSTEAFYNLTSLLSLLRPPSHLMHSKLFSSLLSMENNLNQTDIIPTFQSNEKKTTHKSKIPLMGNALHESSLPSFHRNRGTRRKRREYLKAQKKDSVHDHLSGKGEEQVEVELEVEEEDDDDDEKIEVKRKIVALQRIVPGGGSLGADKLFEETAEYILALQCQIKTMRVLTSFIEGLEKQKRKLGG